MIVKTIKVGYLETNCYILIKDNDALIIDPGDEYNKIEKEIQNLNIEAILITHHHFDHVGALSKFKNIKIIDNNLEEQEYEIGKFKFEIIKTPGHTSDSISFYFKEENIMFVGDFVFENSIGRTDLDSGNNLEMKKSIEKLKTYPIKTKLYPGHGDATTLEQEIKNNPFF
jgi:glyoxylase-like metal-dependent hydrolase (beta-lactamase superfamily II)